MRYSFSGWIRKYGKWTAAAAAIAVIGCFGAVTAEDFKDITELPDSIKVDPINGAWKDRIVPKHRAIISYMDNNYNIQTFRGQGENVSASLGIVGSKIPTDINSELGLSGNSDNRIFAMSACEGKVLGTAAISPDFYGTTEFTDVPVSAVCNAYFGLVSFK